MYFVFGFGFRKSISQFSLEKNLDFVFERSFLDLWFQSSLDVLENFIRILNYSFKLQILNFENIFSHKSCPDFVFRKPSFVVEFQNALKSVLHSGAKFWFCFSETGCEIFSTLEFRASFNLVACAEGAANYFLHFKYFFFPCDVRQNHYVDPGASRDPGIKGSKDQDLGT